MAHPDIQLRLTVRVYMVLDILQQARRLVHCDPRVTELLESGRQNLAAQLGRHGVQAIADSQHGNVQVKNHGWRLRSVFGVNRLRTTGQDDALWCEASDLAVVRIPGPDFTINSALPDPPGNQLGVLRTEIQDQDPVLMNIVCCCHVCLVQDSL